MDTMGYDGHANLALDKCVNLEREIWFKLGRYMWRNHQSVYQEHIKYTHNNIVKPFHIKIIRYAKHVREMHDLAVYLPTPSMKAKSAKATNCTVCDQEFMVSEIMLGIKDGLSSSMQDELEDHH